MVENRNDITQYRKIENLQVYVQEMRKKGEQILVAEKTARISARPGVPGEKIISWSADAQGAPLMEKEAVVSADAETGIPDWVVTKVDERGNVIIDQNGHKNQWIITNIVFQQKYETDQVHSGLYKPVGKPQQFVKLSEAIHIQQWGEEWNVDCGGYINVTDPEDMYVISKRDFADTYRILD